MKIVNANRLDTIRHIENYIKERVVFAVPKFIIRNVILLVMKSNSSQDVYNEVYVYLIKISKQGIIKNINLLKKIHKTFLDVNMIE